MSEANERAARLRELLARVPGGEWSIDQHGSGRTLFAKNEGPPGLHSPDTRFGNGGGFHPYNLVSFHDWDQNAVAVMRLICEARNALPELLAERDALRARVAELERFARNVATNYDCDSDAHRYGTFCRCCEAAKLLQAAGEGEKW